MPLTQIAFNATTKVVKLQMPGDTPGAGFEDLGDVDHQSGTDPLGVTAADNHVLFHHVRDLLYKEGELDMQSAPITGDRVTSIDVTPATDTLAALETQQLTVAYTPATAYNRRVTYESSDVTKATVSAAGLVTGVATGSATITIRGEDSGVIDTVAITVS